MTHLPIFGTTTLEFSITKINWPGVAILAAGIVLVVCFFLATRK
jgi:hypothetical protein